MSILASITSITTIPPCHEFQGWFSRSRALSILDLVQMHKEKSNKMQQCIKILLFHIYMKFNMFRATHRPSSGA